MQKTCVELGLQECYYCKYIIGGVCWVSYWRKELMFYHNKGEVKRYLTLRVNEWRNQPRINYLLAAISSVCPEYLSFMDKALLLI